MHRISFDKCFASLLYKDDFTAETQRTLRFVFIVFSPEREENTMGQAL